MSPFPQYRSKALTALIRQVNVLRDRTQTLARHAKVVGKWTLEVALYPLYRWTQFQATIGKQLRQSFSEATAFLSAADPSQSDPSTPIENVLASLELCAPDQARFVSVTSKTKTSLAHPRRPKVAQLMRRGITAIRNVGTALAFPSNVSGPLDRFNTTLQRQLPSEPIQGIASDLQSRSLVLVTPKQEILNILTPSQQARFKFKIAWVLHHSAVQLRLGQVQRQLSPRPQRLALNIGRLGSSAPALAPRSELAPKHRLSSKSHSLVRRFNPIKAIATVCTALGLAESISTKLDSASQLPQLQHSSVAIQGIASSLDSRRLVLVTPSQTVLDILTPQQQATLQLKISWELYRFSMRAQVVHVQHVLTAGLSRLGKAVKFTTAQIEGALPSNAALPKNAVLVPISNRIQAIERRVRGLQRWGIRALVGAIATLPIVAIPALAAEETSPTPPAPSSSLEAQWVDPSHLRARMALDELQGMVDKTTPGVSWLATVPSARQPKSSLDHSFYAPDQGIEIPIKADFLGYEPHLLEQILGWLDTLLLNLEGAIALLWKWGGLIVVAGFAMVQKVRETLFG